ncbi:hypothetical protein [Borrelia sp. P9F1]|uniref:hypothetical protein n=1 Tax=Borrelia sp. P9F1 TaxID=3058374 RepID=UPI0026498067|nr:hypothetical protein [Borrelia sp. P9F1]WKC58704.1 hypothetical protein QYZ68_05735 [Borrelia sp. P9F1]
MRCSPEQQCERESVFSNTIKDFFLHHAPSLVRPLFPLDLKVLNQENFLGEQIGSFLAGMQTQDDLSKEGINNTNLSNLPFIGAPESDNDLDLTTEEYSTPRFHTRRGLLDSLSLEGNSDEKVLSGSLIENLLPKLMRLLNLIPDTLGFALKSIPNKREGLLSGNLDSNLKEPRKLDFLNNPDSHLFSADAQDKFNIKLDLHKDPKEFNWNKQVNSISNTNHEKLNMDLMWSSGPNLAGIEDVTYSNAENKSIKDILADTGKFETQVDMNDFILKTCGFKSLLARFKSTSRDETLLDTVKLASCLKSDAYMQDNEEAVSVVYDLFKGDQRRLDSISKKTYSKSNSCVLENKQSNDFTNTDNACLTGYLIKNKLNSALERFSRNLDSDQVLNPSSINSSGFKDNVQLLTEQIRELLSCFGSLDLAKNIVEPLSDAFLNMENAINNLTDSLKVSVYGNRLSNNMHDYKAGSESSRMP